MSQETLALVARWRDDGDQCAAEELFRRYLARLIGLTRKRIAGRLGRRIDVEDVLQSAWRTFFIRIRDGRIEVKPGDDLWQLVATIALRKLGRQWEHHAAGKRSVRCEEEPASDADGCSIPVEKVARDPSPDEEVAFQEELDVALAELSPVHRRIVELRLAGCTQTEIEGQTGRGDRLIRVVLSDFGRKFRNRLQRHEDA